MKKTLIIGLTAAMLLSASPAFAKSNGHGENEKKEHGRGNSKSFVVNATTTAQITSIKKQIDDLNKQLQELKRTSRISGQTIRKEEREERNAAKACAQFIKKHSHWKWRGHGHRGWWKALDQNIPEYCKRLPGYGTSTTPVVDVTAPTISGVAVSGIASTSAVVNWTANEGATSKIFVSTSSPVATNVTPTWTDAATTTTHGVQLVGLIPSTTYYFIIVNRDVANNTATSSQGSFVTASIADTVAPIISGISVSNLSTTGATISWNTNESASSKVFISTSSPAATSTATWTDAGFATNHAAALSGLATGTTYYFVIGAADAALNASLSAQGSFVTNAVVADTVAPVISALSAVPTGSTTATVAWTTNEVADSVVYFSTTSPLSTATAGSASNGTLLTNHSVNLASLTASTTYYIVVASKDAVNNLATSSQTSFTTSN
jgi:TolA-binding protein